MRVTVDIPDGLMEQVMALGGFRTKRAAAVSALQECIRRHRHASGDACRLEPQTGAEGSRPGRQSLGGRASEGEQPRASLGPPRRPRARRKA